MRLAQIDFMKGVAIASVVLLHSLPEALLAKSYSILHIWQAVPVFVIIAGMNFAISSEAKSLYGNPLYNLNDMKRRGKRVVYPFLITLIVSLIIVAATGGAWGRGDIYIGRLWAIGVLPTRGPGNYFVTLLFQIVLLLPPMYRICVLSRWGMLVGAFCASLAFELAAPYVHLFDNSPYFYSACSLRYLFALSLGIVYAKFNSWRSKMGIILLLGTIGSISYFIAERTYGFRIEWFREEWRTQNVLSFFYPCFLVVVGKKFLPQTAESLLVRSVCVLGKASYHIFLVQAVLFGTKLLKGPGDVSEYLRAHGDTWSWAQIGGINFFWCCVVGLLFFFLESRLRRNRSAVQIKQMGRN